MIITSSHHSGSVSWFKMAFASGSDARESLAELALHNPRNCRTVSRAAVRSAGSSLLSTPWTMYHFKGPMCKKHVRQNSKPAVHAACTISGITPNFDKRDKPAAKITILCHPTYLDSGLLADRRANLPNQVPCLVWWAQYSGSTMMWETVICTEK